MFDTLLAILVRVAALQVVLGWLLSAVSWLTPAAYGLIGLPATLAAIWYGLKRPRVRNPLRLTGRLRNWWRCRRWPPLIFLGVFLVVLVGAFAHLPNNFDGLSYRVPRTLYWLEAQRWTWIDTPYAAMNHTMPNFEWLSLPLFLVGGTRLVVMINLVSFLLLPPLFFSLLRRFGTSPRLAYAWMWLFPCGYLVAMQGGGIGNDLPGMAAILAAVYFAGRFADRGNGHDLCDALLAAGLCTGMKLTNVPLAGLVIIVLLKNWRLVLARRRALVAGVMVGAMASALIPMGLNWRHSGSILGTTTGMDQVANPAAGFLGNTLIVAVSAVAPPVLPGAKRIGEMAEGALGSDLLGWLKENYFKFSLRINELPQEEGGGLGLGITLALVMVCLLAVRCRASHRASPQRISYDQWQRWSWLLLLLLAGGYVLAKLGTGPAAPRNLMPWMPLALAPFLGWIGYQQILRSRLWHVTAVLAALSVLPALLLTPSRPLVPQGLLLSVMQKAGVGEATRERARIVYATYQRRADPFAELRQALPTSARKLGLVSDGGEPTYSWLIPRGSRTAVYLRTAAEVSAARTAGIEQVVLKEPACRQFFNCSTAQWCEQFRARPVKSAQVYIFAADGPVQYTLVQLLPAGL